MKTFSVSALVVSGIAGGLSAGLVPTSTWEVLRVALLPALSIVAAAVLVRLARGMPFTNADHFSLEEFRSAAQKIESNAKKLRALIFVCLAAVVSLIFAPELVEFAQRLSRNPPSLFRIIDGTMSAVVGISVVYSFTRIIEVVHSDIGLLRLQSLVLEKAISKKNVTEFDKKLQTAEPGKISGAKDYGKSLS